MVNIAVLGYGVVGSGVVEVIKKNRHSIGTRAGEEIKVKKVLDIRDFTDCPDAELMTKDAEEVFKDDSISILVETIGGTKFAYDFTRRALSSGKSVVTSNKELVATHGPELLKMARDNNVSYLFEASVGGGIPIVRPLNQCLAANEIIGIAGILNGTTNYILTSMRKEGKDFGEALKDAQEKGYAEADPSSDIDGVDACRKIAILSSISYNEFVDANRIYTEGIREITLEDMQYAKEMDSKIKLLAISRRYGENIFARVTPVIVNNSGQLANVEGVFNAIIVRGNAIGDAMFYGRGAGKLPTASAVVADVIDIVKHVESNSNNVWKIMNENNIVNIDETESEFFVRLKVKNHEGAEKLVKSLIGDVEKVVLQMDFAKDEYAFKTDVITEKSFKGFIKKLNQSDVIEKVANTIRFFEE
ncbi:MAG: homoserine dehydrogenase [Clostridia bacterium]|jgi:homoserine dehydrogenase